MYTESLHASAQTMSRLSAAVERKSDDRSNWFESALNVTTYRSYILARLLMTASIPSHIPWWCELHLFGIRLIYFISTTSEFLSILTILLHLNNPYQLFSIKSVLDFHISHRLRLLAFFAYWISSRHRQMNFSRIWNSKEWWVLTALRRDLIAISDRQSIYANTEATLLLFCTSTFFSIFSKHCERYERQILKFKLFGKRCQRRSN